MSSRPSSAHQVMGDPDQEVRVTTERFEAMMKAGEFDTLSSQKRGEQN